MTLICIDRRSPSPATHKSNFLPGRKSPENNKHNNNNNINQQNANSNHHHHRRNSCSPPISKSQQQQQDVIKSQNQESRKLERSASDPDRRAVQTNSSRYKTELCRPYEESGDCKYGDKCQFAHGMKELRTMQRHPKYKTELCRTFHSTGLCPYGPRCHFIHNSEQAKKSLLTNLTGNVSTTPSYSRQKILTSLGSAGDISPPSSHAGTPTVMKSFDDLYKQQGPLSPGSLNPLVNLNHQNYDCGPLDCFSDAFNLLTEGGLTNGEVCLDNYGIIGGIISDYCSGIPATEDGYFRVPVYSRFLSKQ